MRDGYARAGVAVSLLSLVTCGCSFLFVQGPPRDHRERPDLDCTLSEAAPRVDTVLMAAGGASTLFLFLLSGLSDTSDPRGKIALLSVPFFFLPAGSAVYGFSEVRSCRAAKAELLARPQLPSATPVSGAPTATQVGVSMRWAVVASPGDVRTAPYLVAPILARMPPGQRVLVSADATNGWRLVAFPDGRTGYIQDAQALLEHTAPDR